MTCKKLQIPPPPSMNPSLLHDNKYWANLQSHQKRCKMVFGVGRLAFAAKLYRTKFYPVKDSIKTATTQSEGHLWRKLILEDRGCSWPRILHQKCRKMCQLRLNNWCILVDLGLPFCSKRATIIFHLDLLLCFGATLTQHLAYIFTWLVWTTKILPQIRDWMESTLKNFFHGHFFCSDTQG